MLKITTQNESGVMTIRLEGKLVGPWVKELEMCWDTANKSKSPINPLRVDLLSVTFIDAGGKDLLKNMYQKGAELVAAGCLTKSIVEEIQRFEMKKKGED